MCEQLKRLPLILIFSYYTSKSFWSTALLFAPFKSETINQLTFEGVFLKYFRDMFNKGLNIFQVLEGEEWSQDDEEYDEFDEE